MNENRIFKNYEDKISKIKSGNPKTPQLINDCIDSIKRFNKLPESDLFEYQQVTNDKICSLCEASGITYESVLKKIDLPKC